MKNTKAKLQTILNAVVLVLSLALTVGVKTVFSACGPKEDGSFMNCHNAEMAVFAIGIALSITALMALLLKGAKLKAGLTLGMVPVAVICAVLPNNFIKLCMMTDMHCHSVMRPAVIITSALIAVIAAVSAVIGLKNDGE